MGRRRGGKGREQGRRPSPARRGVDLEARLFGRPRVVRGEWTGAVGISEGRWTKTPVSGPPSQLSWGLWA